MCNCNQERTTYSRSSGASQRGMVKVKLIKDKPMALTGNITGRIYLFRDLDEVLLVDRRDAMGMKGIEELQLLS